MLNLLLLVNLVTLVAFVVGLYNPKLVLRGSSRTRLKSSGIYLGLFIASGLVIGVLNQPPIPHEVAVAPATKRKSEATPKQFVNLTPSPTPTATPIPTQEAKATPELTPSPTPEFVAFDPSVCKTGDYLPVNGASIALYTTCQYININSLKPESVSVVTGANDKNNNDVSELMAESGFEGVTWRNYTLDPESKRDVCVEYKDESVSCFTFSDPNQTAGVQIQPQDTSIPAGSKCEDFATQAEAQAALPNNPQLDRDGDGTACDSLTSEGGGSRHTGSRRKRK